MTISDVAVTVPGVPDAETIGRSTNKSPEIQQAPLGDRWSNSEKRKRRIYLWDFSSRNYLLCSCTGRWQRYPQLKSRVETNLELNLLIKNQSAKLKKRVPKKLIVAMKNDKQKFERSKYILMQFLSRSNSLS